MTKKTIYNLEVLVSVEIKDKRLCKYLTYKPEVKFIFTLRRAGFWSDTHRYSKEYLEETGYHSGDPMLVEEILVYFKPYVTLKFMGDQFVTKKFNTFEEAKKWGEKQAMRGIHVQLEIEN